MNYTDRQTVHTLLNFIDKLVIRFVIVYTFLASFTAMVIVVAEKLI
jgi:hypothetical protein